MDSDVGAGGAAPWARVGTVAERVLTVAVFCALSGSFERLRYSLLTSTIMLALTVLLLAGSLVGLVARSRQAGEVFAELWPNLLIVALALLSASWSIAPAATWRHSFALVAATAFALYAAARFSLAEHLDLLLAALTLIAAYSLAAVCFAAGGSGTAGAVEVRGWFTSNNHLGRCMSLGVVTAAVTAVVPRRRVFALASATLTTALMFASASRSAWIVTLVTLVGIALLMMAQAVPARARALAATAIALAVSAALALVWHADVVFGWLGRDATMSKRTVLWSLLFEQWSRRPWLGYGLGAFWQGKVGASGEVAARLGYYPWHAHNGFLELALDLGAIGFGIFVGLLLAYGQRALQAGMASRVRWALWPAVYIGYFVASNLTESELVRYDSLYWVLYLIAAARTGAPRQHFAARAVRREPALDGGGSM